MAVIEPIAHIKTGFAEKFGIPRQSGRVPSLAGRIVFETKYRNPDALREIEGFSHLWLIFDFSAAHTDTFSPTVRPPRLGGNRRVGVFASRSPFRPNSLGLSCVKLERVEHTERDGDVLVVSGVDLLDGTPIYDVKPYLPSSDMIGDAVGGYADAEASHKLTVICPDGLLDGEIKDTVVACIADDPRPAYQEDGRTYSFTYAGVNVSFTVTGDTATVTGAELCSC